MRSCELGVDLRLLPRELENGDSRDVTEEVATGIRASQLSTYQPFVGSW
jgi:hypothetical protein